MKVNIGNTRTRYEICSKLITKIPEQRLSITLENIRKPDVF